MEHTHNSDIKPIKPAKFLINIIYWICIILVILFDLLSHQFQHRVTVNLRSVNTINRYWNAQTDESVRIPFTLIKSF